MGEITSEPSVASGLGLREGRDILLTCSFSGVSDGIRTHDIQDHNLAL